MILQEIPTPRHRCQYPGELSIYLGSHIGDDGQTCYPAGLSVILRSAGLSLSLQLPDCFDGARAVAAAGICELVAKDGEPVLLITGEPAGDGLVDVAALADLATFTGTPLAHELLGHMDDLLARFQPSDLWLERMLQFRDPAAFNDLITGLAVRHLHADRGLVLAGLLAEVEEASGPQLAWYAANGSSEDGETRASYDAEAAAFKALVGAYRNATQTQIAA